MSGLNILRWNFKNCFSGYLSQEVRKSDSTEGISLIASLLKYSVASLNLYVGVINWRTWILGHLVSVHPPASSFAAVPCVPRGPDVSIVFCASFRIYHIWCFPVGCLALFSAGSFLLALRDSPRLHPCGKFPVSPVDGSTILLLCFHAVLSMYLLSFNHTPFSLTIYFSDRFIRLLLFHRAWNNNSYSFIFHDYSPNSPTTCHLGGTRGSFVIKLQTVYLWKLVLWKRTSNPDTTSPR